jgi:LacI family transcriptional regulator
MAVTLKQVAEHAGVGYATASRVLNNRSGVTAATRQRVMKAVRELSYVPNEAARGLVMRRDRVPQKKGAIAFLLPKAVPQVDPRSFQGRIFQGVEKVLRERQQRLLFHSLGSDPATESLLTELSMQVDGLLVAGKETLSDAMLSDLAGIGLPIVLVDYHTDAVEVNEVVIDNVGGACQAVRYLAGLGHRRVAIVNGHLGHPSARERLDGYRRTRGELGLDQDEALAMSGEFTLEGGREAVRRFMKSPQPPTAIFCASDLMACGVLQGLHEMSLRVPDDVSVIGFDDLEAGFTSPPLTTLRVDMEGLGAMAARRLLDLIQDEDLPTMKLVAPAKLVERESCRAIGSRKAKAR